MKHNFLRRSAASALTALMCAASIPAMPTALFNTAYAASAGQTLSVGNGQNQHKEDNVGGYSYEIWLDNTGGSGSMTLGSGGTFNTEWSAQVSSGNFLARRGRNYDASKKATQYGPIVMEYAADYSASAQGNSRLCVYGWFKDPLVEYYIIEDWVNWRPTANGAAQTVTIDGAEYEIFQLDHTGPTILGDTRTFKQYFSVRKQKRTSGTITVSDHFAAWEKAGWNIGNLTEVALNVEGWESSGKANVSKLTIGSEGGGNNDIVVETPQNTESAQGGNTGGFDMGGFDFGNMGGGQGGFDFGNMGGNQGGFDWGNMGGGQGGFDWGNMGGGQGGFDFGNMGGFGGDQGGNQGGIDWGGMAGGFNGGGANIGSDAGDGGNAKSGLNAKIKGDMPTTVPAGAEKSGGCKVEKKTYNCKFTGGQKSCNVILPPNYSSSKQYPVMYVLHGIGGDESSMVNGMGVQELLAGLTASGQAEEMIIVLPSQYTSKTGNGGGGFGINQETCAAYDNFLYDISDSLIDFIEQNYSVKPGRENRAITGFSMGGREAIYIGLMRPDLFAYVGGACPAPGIVPGKDMFMEHPGCMTESEMKFRDVGPEPDVFMITGGTNDSVVGTFPKEYSDILTRNGVEHVYQSIPGGGHGADSVKPHLYTFMRYAFKGSSESGATVTTAPAQQNTTNTTTTTTATTTSGGGFDFGNFGGGNQAGQADFSSKVTKWGDANVDDTVSMADAVIIMQSLANPSSFKLEDQGKLNGDVYQAGSGITNQDAATIQKFLLGLLKDLPESYAEGAASTPATTTKAATTTTSKAVTTTTTTQPAAQGGFDMSQFGGQGGFDMSQFGGQGGFDMSQFGGQGGFDMSQFGGQGGFDMSQFGGQGGFDMSQFGGQGGFDMSQFGGQGGFDMSQMGNFNWGNGGVTVDNNQPAQTTVNTAVQSAGAQDLSGKKLVAISFDDGASATSRQDPAYRIMDALIENNFHATFFYVSDWIKTNEQVKFAYENGMEVANHTKSHPSLGSLGADQIRSEWEQCNSKLKSIIGTEPSHLMRLPYLDGGGQVTTALYDVPLISCGLDTKDWDGASADQIVNTIKSAAQNGSLQNQIVLCHENYASTAQAMETVLPWLKQNGWEVVTVSDMFKANGKQLQGGQIYTRS